MSEQTRRESRRRFLGWTMAAVAAGGAGVAAIRATGYELPEGVASKLVALSPWQWLVLDAFGKRVLAPEQADVADFVDTYLLGLAESDARDLLAFVAYLEHVAPLRIGLLRRFTRLHSNEQERVMASIESSSFGLLRGGFQALKALAMMAYYRRPESWPALGYGGPVVRWQG